MLTDGIIDYQKEADKRTETIKALIKEIPTIETEYLGLLMKLITYETELRDSFRDNKVTEALIIKPSLAMREMMIAMSGSDEMLR